LEERVTEQKEVLKQKLPEIDRALQIVIHLKQQQVELSCFNFLVYIFGALSSL